MMLRKIDIDRYGDDRAGQTSRQEMNALADQPRRPVVETLEPVPGTGLMKACRAFVQAYEHAGQVSCNLYFDSIEAAYQLAVKAIRESEGDRSWE